MMVTQLTPKERVIAAQAAFDMAKELEDLAHTNWEKAFELRKDAYDELKYAKALLERAE